MRDICTRLLKKAGHEVLHASNGNDAVDIYASKRPDGVLLDVSMPGLNGLETLQAIRLIDPNARVAMLTAYSDHEMVARAIGLGARDYVTKPFQRDRLLAAVERLVAS